MHWPPSSLHALWGAPQSAGMPLHCSPTQQSAELEQACPLYHRHWIRRLDTGAVREKLELHRRLTLEGAVFAQFEERGKPVKEAAHARANGAGNAAFEGTRAQGELRRSIPTLVPGQVPERVQEAEGRSAGLSGSPLAAGQRERPQACDALEA